MLKYKINQWKTVGVDFVNYGYFPEFDERTGEFFQECEDHGNLLTCLTNNFRERCIHGIDLQYFVEALNDPDTGVTRQALNQGKGERNFVFQTVNESFLWGYLTS